MAPTHLSVVAAEEGERHVQLLHHADEEHRVSHAHVTPAGAPHTVHQACCQAHPHHQTLDEAQQAQESHLQQTTVVDADKPVCSHTGRAVQTASDSESQSSPCMLSQAIHTRLHVGACGNLLLVHSLQEAA